MYVHGALFCNLKCFGRLNLLGQPMSLSLKTPYPKSHLDSQRRMRRRPEGPALDSRQVGGLEAQEGAERTCKDAKGLAAWSVPVFGVYGERQLHGRPVLARNERGSLREERVNRGGIQMQGPSTGTSSWRCRGARALPATELPHRTPYVTAT